MEDYFYHTDPETRLVYLFVRDRAKEKATIEKYQKEQQLKRSSTPLDRTMRVFYDKHIFLPQNWENKSQVQIQSERLRYSLKFLVWSLSHRDAIEGHCVNDWKYISGVRTNMIMNTLYFGMITFAASKFMKKLNPPFFFEELFGKKFTTTRLRYSLVSLIAGGTIYTFGTKLLQDDFLFDTGLKYRRLLNLTSLSDTLTDQRVSLPTNQTKV